MHPEASGLGGSSHGLLHGALGAASVFPIQSRVDSKPGKSSQKSDGS